MNAWRRRGYCRAGFPDCKPEGKGNWRGNCCDILTLLARSRRNSRVYGTPEHALITLARRARIYHQTRGLI